MVIDGRKIAGEILAELAEEVKNLPKPWPGRPPKMAAVLVGNIGGSRKFLELKQKAAEKIGIDYNIYEFPADSSTEELRDQIEEIAKDVSCDGVIIELPLPPQVSTQDILDIIPKNKDADVLSQKAQNDFYTGKSKILPPAVEALRIVFEKNEIDITAKKCAVFGQGLLVGKPISYWLDQNGAMVTSIDEFTEKPGMLSKDADIIVSGVGKANLIKGEMVKKGVVVIDFGYNNINGKTVGDVDFEAVIKKASLITPVPGGMGPVVIAAVFKNLIKLMKHD
jgi:methylenetetrahydrofolate dehydrogenase (NADP+)/methenyltetrahydrofolate cyclohydrolase